MKRVEFFGFYENFRDQFAHSSVGADQNAERLAEVLFHRVDRDGCSECAQTVSPGISVAV